MADVSVVIPARDEPMVPRADDVLVVVDHDADTTPGPRMISTYGPGPANAIRYGIDHAGPAADVIVLACGDGSDDLSLVPQMAALVGRGYTVVCADRYMTGGQRTGGPRIKGAMSRLANRALGVDATNLYKAYDAAWLRRQVIESRHGFTIGLEMIAKARRDGRAVTRVPVTWRDRTAGRSHWRWSWLPAYLRWWAAARMAMLGQVSTARPQSSAPMPNQHSAAEVVPARPTGSAP